MPVPNPPLPSAKPAWFSLSRWFGAARAPVAAPRGHASTGVDADVEQLRTQARRRLIGAVVLLAVGVVAFPLVFETEPRPMGVDTPMQRVQGVVTSPVVPTPAPSPAASPEPTRATDAGSPAHTTDPAAAAATASTQQPSGTVAPPTTASPAVATAAPVAAPAPQPAVATAPVNAPVAAPIAPATKSADSDLAQRAEAQRARALLEGRSAAAAAAPAAAAEPLVAARYVVQVGAYTEPKSLRDVRSRVERLGLKTYTQVINSPAGQRTRVRVGPFDSRAEADAAGKKLQDAGLPVAILTL